MTFFLILFLIFIAMVITLRIFYLVNYKKCKNCKHFQVKNEAKGHCMCHIAELFGKQVNYDHHCEKFELL